jgi:hypothetical protein
MARVSLTSVRDASSDSSHPLAVLEVKTPAIIRSGAEARAHDALARRRRNQDPHRLHDIRIVSVP